MTTQNPTNPNPANSPSKKLILTAEEWLNHEFTVKESEVLVGDTRNPLVRPQTKNLVQAPEKAFKTTFLMRLTLGISTGETVFQSLAVKHARRVLYLHGELSPVELKERLQTAIGGLKRPLNEFIQGRSLDASLVSYQGQTAIRQLVEEHQPEVLVIDPWQSFIAGADENSFKEISPATLFMDKLIAEYNLTIFLAVHLGKNHARGARGHSLLAGWRDTLIELTRKDKHIVNVKVDPRWAKAPPDFQLSFANGTLIQGGVPSWTTQEDAIRKLVMTNGGQLSREQLQQGLELEDTAFRVALLRAKRSGAIKVDGDQIALPPIQ